ncbi:hypothetical protein [Streptomyces sclerotialus]|uniref:hypothetical protein n=1 Tax=Streptomyces sclerotialus TaxID=1957 RepID=UPI00068CA32D
MPEPGSKKFDRKRAQLRREAEDHGTPDQRANEEAKARLEEDPHWQTHGPRAERGLGPKGQRNEREDQRDGRDDQRNA